jgi:hypothetical protein
MTLEKFIKKNREQIDRVIKRIWPRVKPLNDAERKVWILNEMSLVHWVESQGGKIINEEFERAQRKGIYLPLLTLLRRRSSFTTDDRDGEERR